MSHNQTFKYYECNFIKQQWFFFLEHNKWSLNGILPFPNVLRETRRVFMKLKYFWLIIKCLNFLPWTRQWKNILWIHHIVLLCTCVSTVPSIYLFSKAADSDDVFTFDVSVYRTGHCNRCLAILSYNNINELHCWCFGFFAGVLGSLLTDLFTIDMTHKRLKGR